MSLRERLAAQIRATGPLTVAQYMTACLHDPDFGYYATRPALGETGDFITAPLVSQMFGELIGLWAAEAWARLGRPGRIGLVEAGPGDGTLMSDILRAARAAPDFLAACEVWLLETSEPLRAAQRARLGEAVRWADGLDALPADAPLLLVANELLDCLPARQWVRTGAGWAERMVGLGPDGALAFGLGPRLPLRTTPPDPPPQGEGDRESVEGVPAEAPGVSTPSVSFADSSPWGGASWTAATMETRAAPDAPASAVLEVSTAQENFAAALAARLAAQGGAALLIDYGRAEPGTGDTLQALRRHRKVDPLADPGEADLTVYADFPAVLAAARPAGAQAAPLLTQGEFLRRLGIEIRADALARARPDRADAIARQLERLVAPAQMGDLFKVACLHSAGWTPPGFETP